MDKSITGSRPLPGVLAVSVGTYGSQCQPLLRVLEVIWNTREGIADQKVKFWNEHARNEREEVGPSKYLLKNHSKIHMENLKNVHTL